MIEIDRIYQGDSEHKLKDIDDCSVDLVVTDPPYGYGFMGKNWDKALPSINIWRGCLRILKDGAFMFVMSSPRQDVLSRMIINLQDAGFEVGFTSIYWTYASGFPKASNISKMVDKRFGAEREVISESNRHGGGSSHIFEERGSKPITEASTPEAKAVDGSYGGFQPKPAVEVVLVVMKPLSEKTFVDQALKNGHGVTWLDDGRIPCDIKPNTRKGMDLISESERGTNTPKYGGGKGLPDMTDYIANSQGRFPANLLVSDDVLNDGRNIMAGGSRNGKMELTGFGGIRDTSFETYNDSGSFSRYFDLDKWWDERIKLLPESVQKTFPFIIVSKASKSEKNKGCEGLENKSIRGRDIGQDVRNVPHKHRTTPTTNHHPTVKPLKLFSYLITLGSREGDLIVDPFVGSGTSCVSAKILGRHWIGIDNEAEYVTIANKRIEAENNQMEFSLAGG